MMMSDEEENAAAGGEGSTDALGEIEGGEKKGGKKKLLCVDCVSKFPSATKSTRR